MFSKVILAALGAAVAVAAFAQGQEMLLPTQVAIRLYEQGGGFVIGPEARSYTTWFDTVRTRRLGVEVSIVHVALPKPMQYSVACEMDRPDGKTVSGIFRIPVKVSAGEKQSSGANTLFGMPEGQEWPAGTYTVRCSGDQLRLGETRIHFVRNPPDVADADIRVAGIRFFQIGKEIPAQDQRSYVAMNQAGYFSSRTTSRIAVELEFRHPPLPKAVSVPVECFYFFPDGQFTPAIPLTYEAPAGQQNGQAARGIGWDEPGNWPLGVYSVMCQLAGHPVAFDRFRVGT